MSRRVLDENGQEKEETSYRTFEAGTNREGWFTNKDLFEQLIASAELFKALHPDCELVIYFDNSMTH